MEEFLKSLNPQKKDQLILIYGRNYHVWRDDQYIGIATWTQDNNIGDSFQSQSENGEIEVYIADYFELIIK